MHILNYTYTFIHLAYLFTQEDGNNWSNMIQCISDISGPRMSCKSNAPWKRRSYSKAPKAFGQHTFFAQLRPFRSKADDGHAERWTPITEMLRWRADLKLKWCKKWCTFRYGETFECFSGLSSAMRSGSTCTAKMPPLSWSAGSWSLWNTSWSLGRGANGANPHQLRHTFLHLQLW